MPAVPPKFPSIWKGDKTVKEIAVLLGIDDSFYFSRLFTKLMGMSPSQYRKVHKL
ncbi:AraC family transcriptional regulator [Parapedobacter defluvii]|uniref:AraC family transcriptional regulator n=1 Tax=Parapedobacter defluvii TaxID=2045106 RepID=UPI001E524C48